MKTFFTSVLFLLFFFESHSQTLPQIFHCLTMGAPASQTEYNQIGYYINNSVIEDNGCTLEPAIVVAVIDSFCHPWNTCEYNFGQANDFTLTSGTCDLNPIGVSGGGTCRPRPENYFIFHFNDSIQMNSLASMIDSVPNDNYILAYTWFTSIYSIVPLFKQTFQNIGATQITSLPDSVPYIFLIKKGDLSTLIESLGNSTTDTIDVSTTINCTTISTSVFENENDLISIFPNPANNNLNISVVTGSYKWEIYSITGQQILSGNILNGFKNVDTSKLSSGLYILKLIDEKGSVNKIFGKL